MSRWLSSLPKRAFLVFMWTGAVFIALASRDYFDFEMLAPFIVEKLPVRFESLWIASLRIHVASALISFPLSLLLMTRFLQRQRAWHRWLGRITGALVLLALVPSGIVLAFDAKGGAVVAAGFLLSAGIVFYCMTLGIITARRGDLRAHSYAMRHVFAQLSVAVTSRAMLVGLDFAGIDPDSAYVAALWVPVLGSIAVVEWISRRPGFATPNFLQTIIREPS